MTLFGVYEGEYDERDLAWVFTTKELAEAYVADPDVDSSAYVSEIEVLDELPTKAVWYEASASSYRGDSEPFLWRYAEWGQEPPTERVVVEYSWVETENPDHVFGTPGTQRLYVPYVSVHGISLTEDGLIDRVVDALAEAVALDTRTPWVGGRYDPRSRSGEQPC